MSNYVPAINVVIDFQGDTVVATIETLENEDFGKLLPFFTENEDGETVLRFEDKDKFQTLAFEFLKKYVTHFEGLKDNLGNEIPLETVLKKTYFMKLTAKLMDELFQNSIVGGDEEKKSDEPSEQGSTESEQEKTQ